MAAREHKVSRRVLLGAAWAMPMALAASPPGRGSSWIPDQVRDDDQSRAVTKWNHALAAFRRAEAAVNAAAGEPDEDRYNALVGRLNQALRRLLRTPAPHLPALAAKLAAADRHTAWELTGAETCIAALARDAARLASLSSRSS